MKVRELPILAADVEMCESPLADRFSCEIERAAFFAFHIHGVAAVELHDVICEIVERTHRVLRA